MGLKDEQVANSKQSCNQCCSIAIVHEKKRLEMVNLIFPKYHNDRVIDMADKISGCCSNYVKDLSSVEEIEIYFITW